MNKKIDYKNIYLKLSFNSLLITIIEFPNFPEDIVSKIRKQGTFFRILIYVELFPGVT